MRSLRYLNTILTVLTVLLALQLWTTWTTPNQPWDHATQAQAQDGLTNAGAQRKQMIDQTKVVAQKMDQLIALFKNGRARVQVEGMTEEKQDK